MSLIDEALKRARLEAAQRAAEGEGLPYPTIPRHLGPRRRRGWLAPAAVALAVLAGLLIGWMVATRGPRAAQVATRGGSAAAAEPVTSGPATPAQVVRDPIAADTEAAAPVGSAASAPPRPVETATSPASPEPTGARPVTSGPARPEEVSRDPVAPAPAEPPPGEPPPSEPRSEPTPPEPTPPETAPTPESTKPTMITDPDSRVLLVLPERPSPSGSGAPSSEGPAESHVQSYPLPDGGAIELGGIAWSETGPFALINGRVVGPGSVIDGYTLEGIHPGHVLLMGEGRRVRLSLQ